jgi:hypothetical protein
MLQLYPGGDNINGFVEMSAQDLPFDVVAPEPVQMSVDTGTQLKMEEESHRNLGKQEGTEKTDGG